MTRREHPPQPHLVAETESSPSQLRARYDAIKERFESLSPLHGYTPRPSVYRHVINGLLQNCLSNLEAFESPQIEEDKKIFLSIAESALADLEFYYQYVSSNGKVLARELRIDNRRAENISGQG